MAHNAHQASDVAVGQAPRRHHRPQPIGPQLKPRRPGETVKPRCAEGPRSEQRRGASYTLSEGLLLWLCLQPQTASSLTHTDHSDQHQSAVIPLNLGFPLAQPSRFPGCGIYPDDHAVLGRPTGLHLPTLLAAACDVLDPWSDRFSDPNRRLGWHNLRAKLERTYSRSAAAREDSYDHHAQPEQSQVIGAFRITRTKLATLR